MPIDKGWSINRSDWESLEQALPRSMAWGRVLLTRNDESVVPARPGVYAICAAPPGTMEHDVQSVFQNLAAPLYIGKAASSIRSRFNVHCDRPSPRLEVAKQCYASVLLHFWFVEMPSEGVETAEALLIKCFGPPVNEKSGTIIGVVKSPVDA